MEKDRLQLHEILCELLGSRNCYFSPPSDLKMSYPCIRYEMVNTDTTFADNYHYANANRYTVTVIDEDPDSKLRRKLLDLPYCTSDRNFASDGLYHFVFTLFF